MFLELKDDDKAEIELHEDDSNDSEDYFDNLTYTDDDIEDMEEDLPGHNEWLFNGAKISILEHSFAVMGFSVRHNLSGKKENGN